MPPEPIPNDVIIRSEARKPTTDPTLGIRVTPNSDFNPHHRLVTIGDSLAHGFQSGAIFKTELSCARMIAKELGWEQHFRYPTYDGPGDGLPLNLERLAREVEERFGASIDILEFVPALAFLRGYLDKIEDYWERGDGTRYSSDRPINHNLAVYGWDLRNTLSRNADICKQVLAADPPKDDFLREVVEHHNERAALRVLNSARNAAGKALSPLQAATALSLEDRPGNEKGGIETLIILIGANNALGSILTFKAKWSADGYDDMDRNDQYTVWRPIHFKAELDKIVEAVKKIRARHVIWGTVPHVTIVPFARGVESKVKPGSRYFPYYTLPWISDKEFKPTKHPNLTETEVRAIDSAIDQYNDAIVDAVRQARQEGRDWYVFEMVALLDRLAARRYLEDPLARPSWWDEVGGSYPLPAALQALSPVPDSKFFRSGRKGRTSGGLFSLDGIHPTTIGYGILAQELIKVMELAGVTFLQSDGTPRSGPVKLDFNKLITLDSLISNPPRSVEGLLDNVGWLDANFNIISSMLMSSY